MKNDPHESLLEELRTEVEVRKKRHKIIGWTLLPLMFLLIIIGIYMMINHPKRSLTYTSVVPLMSLWVVLASKYSPRHQSLIKEIAARKDPAILGELVEIAHSIEDEVRKLAEQLIPPVLEVWMQGENPDLEPKQRSYLYKLLDLKRPIELVEAVHNAIQVTGGLEAVPVLEEFERKVKGNAITRWERLSSKTFEALAEVRMREARKIIDAGPQREDIEPLEQRA